MPSIINHGLGAATTTDWLNATRDMKLTAFDPCSQDLLATILVAHTDVEGASAVPATQENRGGTPSQVDSTTAKSGRYVPGKVTTEQPRTDVVSPPVKDPSAVAVGRLEVSSTRPRTEEFLAHTQRKVVAKKAPRSDWKAKKSR